MKSSKEQQHIERLQDHLLSWYRQNRRKLPWRENISGYRTWVSEIMLQQTRVEAAIPYYERFLNELPNLKHLAAADDDLLHKLWEGLGYYNRVRNMKKCAQVCVEKYGGELPCDYDTLCTLPGSALIRRGQWHPSPFHSGSVQWTAMCCGSSRGSWKTGRIFRRKRQRNTIKNM